MFGIDLKMLALGIGGVAVLVILGIFLLKYLRPGNREVLDRFGLDGWVVYTDSGEKSRVFVSKKWGIKAKPDFVIRLRRGGYALVEFKTRASGRLFPSDVAQVKATVLALRGEFHVTEAYVLAGTARHKIDVSKSSWRIYKEIRTEVEQAKRAESGELILVYPATTASCKNCSQRQGCENPALVEDCHIRAER